MLNRLNFFWRLLATGFCFAIFSIGGALLATMVFQVLWLLPGGRVARTRRARSLVRHFFRLFMGTMQFLGIMRLEIVGRERLEQCRNVLVLANHPTLVDVVALLSVIPNANCVVKKDLWRNPFLMGVVWATNYIRNDAGGEALIDECARSLERHQPLVIFPEGTRSVPDQPLRFQRGPAYVAMKCRRPIQPVLIWCDPPTLLKGERWYRIPPRPFHLRLEAREPLFPDSLVTISDPPPLGARHLTRALEAFFTRELRTYGSTETRDQTIDHRGAEPRGSEG